MGTAPADLAEQFARLAGATYEGWVAWLDQGAATWTPIFEARADNPRLIQVAKDLLRPEEEGARARGRDSMEWREICDNPDLMARVQLLAVFGFYGRYDHQPLAVIQRDSPAAWFINYKARGLQVHHGHGPGQQRTGVMWYRLGFWQNGGGPPSWSIVEVTPEKRGTITRPGRPWAPAPEGLGLDPALCGADGILPQGTR